MFRPPPHPREFGSFSIIQMTQYDCMLVNMELKESMVEHATTIAPPKNNTFKMMRNNKYIQELSYNSTGVLGGSWLFCIQYFL